MNSKNGIQNQPEPLAIIGIGCRFPGGIADPASFWEALQQGKDAITDIPSDRWDLKNYYHPDPDKPGKIYVRKGGFLDNIGYFDPQFFGISPREASYMDPQQRLLLEVTWEALEDAGLPPEKIAGSQTGVYIGLFMRDFESLHNAVTEHQLIGPHSPTGMSSTIAANRISYVFDFKGPSMVIDTACSSSLVGLHLACRSLLHGETDLAVVGGVNLLIKPEMTMALCRGGFLSPDGYCKSFDAAANGYVRSEGVAVVILKRLSDALAHEDPVYALISGSAVNQDGRSEGLTVPDFEAQRRMLEEALAEAGINPEDLQYMEAHGTGTPVGDPIEARAIGSVLSRNRSAADALIIGSVKSNIGHTESTAGLAGLIKVSLMLKFQAIPANLHFQNPNPRIPFEELKLRVPTSLEPWPQRNGKPRLAGVNSFGFGGTNAHVILQEYQPRTCTCELTPERRESPGPGESKTQAVLIPISAHSQEALRETARRLDAWVNENSIRARGLHDIGYSAALHKGRHPHRLALVSRSREEFGEQMAAYLNDETALGVSSGVVGPTTEDGARRLAFIYTGMGPQWWGMGRQLYEQEPVFRQVIAECDRLFWEHTREWSLTQELLAAESESRIQETRIAQPCIFALQAGLTALWRSWGIEPTAIIGHSVGEMAAYHAAGVLTLPDAVKVCFHRSRLQQLKAGEGGMLAVTGTETAMNELLQGYEDQISIAAVNSPQSLTIAGEIRALEEIAARCAEKNQFARFLKVEVPYHSPAMDSILPELRESLVDLNPQPALIPVFSTVTGALIDGSLVNADYWVANVRNSVLFNCAFNLLANLGVELVIEVGPHPVLASSMMESLAVIQKQAVILPSLKRMEDEEQTILATLGRLYTLGYPVSWERLYLNGQLVKLPAYPWQREYYWRESEESRQARMGNLPGAGAEAFGKQEHPLLGRRLRSATTTWSCSIDPGVLSYLADHVVQGNIVYPGAAYLEMALAAFQSIHGSATPGFIESFRIKAPLVLEEGSPVTLQLTLDQEQQFQIFSAQAGKEQQWTLHASGNLNAQESGSPAPPVSLPDLQIACPFEVSKEICYRKLRGQNLEYGPCFQPVETVWRSENQVLARLVIPDPIRGDLEKYQLHPVILDGSFQALSLLGDDGTYLPVKVEGFNLYQKPGESLWVHGVLTEKSGRRIAGNITIFNDAGQPVALVNQLHCRRVQDETQAAALNIQPLLYQYQWLLDEFTGSGCRDSGALPTPTGLASELEAQVHHLIDLYHRQEYYQKVEPQMDRLCTLYILSALNRMGFELTSGRTFSSSHLAEELGVIPEQRSLWQRLLEILREDGILTRMDGEWRALVIPENPETSLVWAEILKQYPSYHAELSLVDRCGATLPEVLTGAADPLSIIFSQSSSTIEQIYRSSPALRIYNRILQEVMGSIISGLAEEKTLKILEIGAGTGSITSHILPLLPAGRSQYWFTDISGMFIHQAQSKFKDYRFVEYQLLDIEKDPVSQGFPLHSFDLVLASDAIHATADLKNTLANIQKLLAPEGLLLFIEQTKITRWFDLVFGLLKGWWLFTDYQIRPDHPLVTLEIWRHLLLTSGFTEVSALPSIEGGFTPQHSLIIAKSGSALDTTPEANHWINPPTPELTARPWVIFADSGSYGEVDANKSSLVKLLAKELRQSNIQPFLVFPGQRREKRDPENLIIAPGHKEDYAWVWETLCGTGAPPPVVIFLSDLSASIRDPEGVLTTAGLAQYAPENCLSGLYLMQTLMSREWSGSPNLWLITRGSQALAGEVPRLEMTPLWGLGRVMINEHPELSTKLLDLSPVLSPAEIRRLSEILMAPEAEDELMLRDQKLYHHRLIQGEYPGAPDPPQTVYSLVRDYPGFEGLTFYEKERKKPGPGEVEVQVMAVGLNFKDLAKVTGVLEGAAYEEHSAAGSEFGLECAGVVTAVGAGVTRFQTGAAVMGLALNCLGNFVNIEERLLAKKPGAISFEEAATLPVSFLTAYYALHQLAGIQKGARILIHTGTGGVGLAAVQVATAAGAVIYTTAGTPEKRDFLKSMGVKYVGDSRSVDFAHEITREIGKEGLDIVLNTLSGKAVEKSMKLLKPIAGQFIDLSNLYNHGIKLHSPEKGISVHTFDLELISKIRPEMIGDTWNKIAGYFEQKIYSPLPHWVFPVAEISTALKTLRRGLHIGKIVVSFTEPGLKPVPTREQINVKPDGTYLITGGLGGFGLEVAKWLVRCGARSLVLVGRSGAATPEAKSVLQELAAQGAQVLVERVDVAQEEMVAGLFCKIKSALPPLKGIVHGAMVLEDTPLMEMDRPKLKKVLDPKILGAWNLHLYSQDHALDFFICFSSISSFLGNINQGNYVAANFFLDSLAAYRKAKSLPALTIGWGPIAGAGYVAQREDLRESLQRRGLGEVSLAQAWKVIALALERNLRLIGVAPVNWKTAAKFNTSFNKSPRFSGLMPAATPLDTAETAPQSGLTPLLSPEERRQTLGELLTKEVAAVLGIPSSKLDPAEPIAGLGFDSLMAVELGVKIEAVAGVKLPKMTLLNPGLNLHKLVDTVALELPELKTQTASPATPALPTACDVENLSDQEVDQMLAAMLLEGGNVHE